MSDFHHIHPASNSLRRNSEDIKSILKTSSTDTCISGLDAFNGAREIVRLIQCNECSKPLSDPITLPCGNSICRECLPPSHLRQNISYPATANRLQGFTCPFKKCGKEHAVEDTSLDVTMAKVMTVIESQMQEFGQKPSETYIQLESQPSRGFISETINTKILPGGRLFATYLMADMGELPFESELEYADTSENLDDIKLQAVDSALLEVLREQTRQELDCQVCYALLLDPLTTPCGHTFCRKCIHRVLDHSSLCPICRRTLSLPSAVNTTEAPSNIRLTAILDALCPSQIAARKEFEESSAQKLNDLDLPIFICALSFPSMPTYLHIFEPRYRLMIRRAMESGNRKFGMVMGNPSQEIQGELGPTNFYQYGTLLQIVDYQAMADGRSMIETVGLSRFKVIRYGMLDGYMIGKVERVDDISIAEEEEMEARDVSAPAERIESERYFASNRHFGGLPSETLGTNTLDSLNPGGLNRILFSPTDLPYLPTSELLKISSNFVARMRMGSAPWLHERGTFLSCSSYPLLLHRCKIWHYSS